MTWKIKKYWTIKKFGIQAGDLPPGRFLNIGATYSGKIPEDAGPELTLSDATVKVNSDYINESGRHLYNIILNNQDRVIMDDAPDKVGEWYYFTIFNHSWNFQKRS
jgi:hypothetical protein